MLKKQVIEAITKMARQHGRADYILGEVRTYLMNHTCIDGDFRDWFTRQWEKYQKGDK